MKRIKIFKSIMLTLLLCIMYSNSWAQNNVWALPNNDGSQGYRDNIDGNIYSFPTTDPSTGLAYTDPYVGYTPSLSNYTHLHRGSANAINGIGGELLFFMVGNAIFDSEGRTIFDGNLDGNLGYGYTDIAVVPDPGNCSRYYLFTEFADQTPFVGTVNYGGVPAYAVLDMSQNNTIPSFNTNATARLLDVNGNPINNFQPLATALGYSAYVENPHKSRLNYAVAKLDPTTNSRAVTMITTVDTDLACGSGKGIVKFKVTASGFDYVGFDELTADPSVASCANAIFVPTTENLLPTGTPIFAAERRSEMEIYMTDAGTYKIAFTSSNKVLQYELDADLIYIPNSIVFINLDQNTPLGTRVEPVGVEFSPNGDYIYFTHNRVGSLTNYIDCWNPITNTLEYLSWANTVDSEFQFSFIEVQGKNLFMAKADYLSKILDANLINTSSFDPIFLSINYTANYWIYNDAYVSGSISGNNANFVKAYTLPTQIDQEDISQIMVNDPLCCLAGSNYDKETFTASVVANPNFTSTTQVWTVNNNPFGAGLGTVANPVYIKNAINIPAGYNITIVGMNIKFHPDAEINIERGFGNTKGGKLKLRNQTKLSADRRCINDAFWQGIDVEGYSNQPQFPLYNTKQAILDVRQNSTIEYAEIGAEATQRFGGNYEPTYSGGIIKTVNGNWLNNKLGIALRNYTPVGASTNACSIIKSKFKTTEYINTTGSATLINVIMFFNQGVKIKGNVFKNEVPALYAYNRRGYGIISFGSDYVVQPYVTQGNVSIPNRFVNLTTGVFSFSGGLNSTVIKESKFHNNINGITFLSVTNGKITNNIFKISDEFSQIKTSGIYMRNSTGYIVENNNLKSMPATSTVGNSHGIVVVNSGEHNNKIYRNFFKDLKIGGQSEHINGELPVGSDVANGLKWQCNKFTSNITVADLTLTSGRIDNHQGVDPSATVPAIISGARNLLSHDVPVSAGQYDILVNDYVDNGFKYYYYTFTPNTIPQDGNYTVYYTGVGSVYPAVQPLPTEFLAPIYNFAESCPSNYSAGGPGKYDNMKISLNNKQSELASIDQQAMLDAIGTMGNGQLKNFLLASSPNLSDEVILAYINSSPPQGHLLQILFNNGPLSDVVLQALDTANAVNNFWLYTLNTYYSGVSPYNTLLNDIDYLKSEKDYYLDAAIADYMTVGNTVVNPIDSVINLLSQEDSRYRKQQLVDAYIYKKELGLAAADNSSLVQQYGASNFSTLAGERIDNTFGACVVTNINADSSSQLVVQTIANDSTNKIVQQKAKCFLDDFLTNNLMVYPIEDIIVDGVVKSNAGGEVTYEDVIEEEVSLTEISLFNMEIYPNPTTDKISVTIQGLDTDDNNVLEVVNVDGKKVYTSKATNSVSTIDVSKLPKGLYFVMVRNSTEMLKLEKLVVE